MKRSKQSEPKKVLLKCDEVAANAAWKGYVEWEEKLERLDTVRMVEVTSLREILRYTHCELASCVVASKAEVREYAERHQLSSRLVVLDSHGIPRLFSRETGKTEPLPNFMFRAKLLIQAVPTEERLNNDN